MTPEQLDRELKKIKKMICCSNGSGGGSVTNVSGTTNRITVVNGNTTPIIDIASTYVGQTSITTLGTIGTGTWEGGTIEAAYGGTGQSTYTIGDLLYASGVTTLSKLPASTIDYILTSNGVGTAPSWEAFPSLDVQSAGSGQETFFVTGDTLMLRDIGSSTFITATTEVDETITLSLSATGTPSATTFLAGDNTWKTPAGSGTVNTGTQYRIAYYATTGTAVSEAAAITGARALVSDANGVPTHSTTTATELGYMNGVTSAIQTQIDGKLSITTTNPSHTGTTPTGTGIIPATMFGIIDSDNTISDVNTAQNVFPSGYDEWTLQGSTTYEFEGVYYITSGATSHNVGISFALGGGASVTSIMYTSMGQIGTTINTTTQTTQAVTTVSNTAMFGAATASQQLVQFKGYIRMNAGGTVTPQLTFSAAPGGTNIVKANSYIKFTPIGTNTVTNQGSVS